jgi:hypothetical protein
MDLETATLPGGAPAAPEEGPAARRRRRGVHRLPPWWQEAIIIAAFYSVYTVIRDLQATPGGRARAVSDALSVIRAEQVLGIWREQFVQQLVLSHRGFMEIWDSYYGTAHFLLVIFVLVVLYFRDPGRYRRWRNALAITTALGLVAFAAFPVAPPRLMPAPYHLVDTLLTVGGFWDFYHGPVAQVSNQYAAMPSLHTAWSTWCAMAVWPMVRPRWGRALLILYPVATVFCIIVTGNHYFLDAAGGVATVTVAAVACRSRLPRRLRRRDEALAAPCESQS